MNLLHQVFDRSLVSSLGRCNWINAFSFLSFFFFPFFGWTNLRWYLCPTRLRAKLYKGWALINRNGMMGDNHHRRLMCDSTSMTFDWFKFFIVSYVQKIGNFSEVPCVFLLPISSFAVGYFIKFHYAKVLLHEKVQQIESWK